MEITSALMPLEMKPSLGFEPELCFLLLPIALVVAFGLYRCAKPKEYHPTENKGMLPIFLLVQFADTVTDILSWIFTVLWEKGTSTLPMIRSATFNGLPAFCGS